jgi:hypothetical protein
VIILTLHYIIHLVADILLQLNKMVSVMVKDILLMFLQTRPFFSTMTIVMVVTSKVIESLAIAQLPLLLLVTLP